MQSTAGLPTVDTVSDDERAELLTNRRLRSLSAVFATIPDPRSCHGKRYSLPYLLTCLVAALLCNCDSVDAVGPWCRDHRALLRQVFGKREHLAPSGSLYRWLLPQLPAARLEWALAGWMATTRRAHDDEAIALDGKTVCGAGSGKGEQPELVSVMTHRTHETLVQIRVPPGTNEIPIAQELLGWLALADRIVTADAQHCQTNFAQAVRDGGGHYLLCLKANWPATHAEVAEYFTDPAAVCTAAATWDRVRGRREHRALRVSSELAGHLQMFPDLAQVAEITRTVQRPGRLHEQTVEYYVTSCPPEVADAAALLAAIRGHWGIESHHWVRDVDFGEDASQQRSGNAPQIMAALRNAAETLLRRGGFTAIAAARRHFARRPGKALTLIRREFPARA